MSQVNIRTLNYAKPPANHYWRWSDGRDAIEWEDWETLALWQEVLTVLNSLQPNGIPPLGSVLILIAACRDDDGAVFIARIRELMDRRLENDPGSATGNGPEPAEPNDSLNLQYQSGGLWNYVARSDFSPLLRGSILDGLQVIRDLPKDLRGSLAAKCHLASLIFENSTHRLSKKDTKEVLNELIEVGPRGLGNATPRYDSRERFLMDLKAFQPGLTLRTKFNSTKGNLESLLRTGLEEAGLQPASLPEPATDLEDPRLLLDKLVATGGECGATAVVAKRAIAMMNFPGQVGAPRDLPVGGIADITNRGTIDRLLPGELAWDDLVLAARLVHNEALYFRREIPPLNVATAHTILLDRSLRLWGCGRVFSLGVALGLWHHPDLNHTGESIECVASTGRDFEHLELDTPAKVAAALETLVPSAGPGSFLHSWWSAAQIVDDPAVPEVSFITEKHSIEDTDTRTLLGEIARWIHGRGGQLRVIALSRIGELEVQSWTPGGNRTLFRGEMDLDEILADPPKPAAAKETPPPLIIPTEKSPLLEISPIYGIPLLPFLFPLLPQANAFLPHDSGYEGGSGVSTKRSFAVWPANGRGAYFLADMPGASHWFSRDDSTGDEIVICSAAKAGEAVRVFRLNKNKLKEIEIAKSAHSFPRHAAASGGAVVLAYSDHAEAFSLKNGHRVASYPIASLPAQPILNFDGEVIRVYDKGKNATIPTEAWRATDKPWPRMIEPEAASFQGDELRLLCSGKIYLLDFSTVVWKEVSGSKDYFLPFHPHHHALPDGRHIQVAGPSDSSRSVWLDPRGFIIVGREAQNPASGWCIMLSTPAASAWHAKFGLCSEDERLRHPGNQAENVAALSPFWSFFRQASSLPR